MDMCVIDVRSVILDVTPCITKNFSKEILLPVEMVVSTYLPLNFLSLSTTGHCRTGFPREINEFTVVVQFLTLS